MPVLPNWRDCQAWRDDGFHWSTTSNEAVKLYDAAVTQVVCYRDEPSLGGLKSTFEKLHEADPNFVMGQLLGLSLDLSGSSIPNPLLHPDMKSKVDKILDLAAGQKLSNLEKKHVEALGKMAEGRSWEACAIYEDILLEQPEDSAAMHMLFFAYFFLGARQSMRDVLAQVVPRCRPNMPLYSYLYGKLGFAYTETNLYEEGERLARKALAMDQHDIWAIHSMAHNLDHTARQREGIDFLTSTMDIWEGKYLSSHNTWHLGLCHLEQNDHEAALSLYDEKLEGYNTILFHAMDRATFLRRLEFKGVDVGSRWEDVYQLGRTYLNDHGAVFLDFHTVLGCLGSKHLTEAKDFLSDVYEVVKKLPSHSYYRQCTESVGVPLYKALVAYEEEDFASAVNELRAVRGRAYGMGGSNAQRDIVDLLLIDAAFKSKDPSHVNLPMALMHERKAMRGSTPSNEDLMTRALLKHDQLQ